MSTTAEATLTRKFSINFIDARSIVTEAKLSLNIFGYPTRAQKELVIAEASKIFESYPETVRGSMKTDRNLLEDAKMNNSSSASNGSSIELVWTIKCQQQQATSLLG
jgi:hypothetical protein